MLHFSYPIPLWWAPGLLPTPGCREQCWGHPHLPPPVGSLGFRRCTVSKFCLILSRRALPVHTPISPAWVWGAHFPTSPPIYTFIYLIVCPSDAGTKWYILVLICASLISDEFGHYHICLIRFLCGFLICSLCPFFFGQFWEVPGVSQNRSWWTTVCGPNPAHCLFLYGLQDREWPFTVFNGWKKNQKNDISWILWNFTFCVLK